MTCLLCGPLQDSELSELSGLSGDEGGSRQGSLQDPGNAVSRGDALPVLMMCLSVSLCMGVGDCVCVKVALVWMIVYVRGGLVWMIV